MSHKINDWMPIAEYRNIIKSGDNIEIIDVNGMKHCGWVSAFNENGFEYISTMDGTENIGFHIYFDVPSTKIKVLNTDNTILSHNNIFMNIVEKARNLLLSKESRLLMDVGIENPDHVLTEDGKEVLWDILEAEYRPKLIEVAQKIKDEEKNR